VAGLALWKGEKFSHLGGAQSGIAATPHQKESVEVVWASVLDAFWKPPQGRCFGHVLQRGGLRADQGLAGEVMSLGWLGLGVPLEMLQVVPGDRLGVSNHTQSRISGRKFMDG